METPKLKLKQSNPISPQTLTPCSSGRRSSDSNSPEFEFWMVRNPSFPQPNLLSADELFVDGILLPLHLLHRHNTDDPPDSHSEPPITTPNSNPPPESEIGSGPELSTATPDLSTTAFTASKRWMDIFKKSDRKDSHSNDNDDKNKDKKKEKKSVGAGKGGASSAELNINIWPFSRSRSAGNGGNRPRMAAGSVATRKVSSAPCSRSNSAGESKSRKWPSSPSRGGVHLGRSSPVWQVRRGGSAGRSFEPMIRNAEKGVRREVNETRRIKSAVTGGSGGAKARVLNLNVPTCIGYRHHLSCRSDGNSAVRAVAAPAGGSGDGQIGAGGVSGDVGRGGNLFSLRSLFTKKVY
ncbi:uncharacterized protein LOC132267328 [Cornus florida]|uniref:uncharacterized protein LOC132267328 n=1 Tax=Cornus florida TaxID=4283 RepID=UPI00289E0C77|nr:uncharacterized protein LOC132267328 [Cornus florida]